MKTCNLFVYLTLLWLVTFLKPIVAFSQPLTDSTVNFFTLSAYYDHYYDSLIQDRGVENMKGTGYTDYLRWKWFYTGRTGADGNLNEVWEGIQDYQENFQAPLEYTDESDWKYAGPFEIPLGHDETSRKETGKGMMLSLWVSGGNHSLMYAGSHHGGLWKTEDGGKNWYPLNDQDYEIHGVNSIAVDPSDYNTLYITSNSSLGSFSNYSIGLFKSTDGGIGWDRLPTTITYPSGSWADELRKIMVDPYDPNNLYLITYRDVARSTDGGNNWTPVFHRDYFPWGDPADPLNMHNGLFDFKISPWSEENPIAYIAGSEIYKITDPDSNFNAENISDNVFLIGLNPEDIMINHPHRTEISMNEKYLNVVWFCYACEYDRGNGRKNYLRIVRLDGEGCHLLFDEDISGCADIGVSGNKLEFAVSPSSPDNFYIGGIYMEQVTAIDGLSSTKGLSSGEYPDDCWVHDDIRDMQIFSDGAHDTLYLANDAGVSWGTPYENNPDGCGNGEWQWFHPFNSGENGLNVTEFYGIGLSKGSSELIAGGCQDLGDMLLKNGQWINFGFGDGSDLVWDPGNSDIFYFSEWQTGTLCRTNDLGFTRDDFGYLGKSNLMIPLELDRYSDPDPAQSYTILYSSRRDPDPQFNGQLIKYSYVDRFDIHEFVPDVLHKFYDSLSDIEVVRIDQSSRMLYVSTFKSYHDDEDPPEPEYYTGCIYRSIYVNNPPDFEDISSGLNGCLNGFISDIEVHPNQISKVWVAFANYSRGSQDSKVYTSANSGDSWELFSDGLPPGMPVFNLRYYAEFNFLLAVTDVGVFKNDLQGEDWYPFNNNLPSKIVTDVEINRDLNTIVAATYGRGLWKTPLRCHYTGGSDTLDENTKWTITMLLEESIVIPAGITLTIEDGSVYLPSEAKIVVERGGTLILDGATLTSACNDLWWGVEVQGDSRYEQSEGVQGKIILNDAVIEKARKAIFCGRNIEYENPDREYTGGIVDATDAMFINNRFGVMFWYYPFENVSHFTNCRFQTTELLADGSSPEFFMTMVKVKGIDIGGCEFENLINSAPLMQNQGSAIFALDAGFEIHATNPPFITSSKFKNLEYGIFAMKYAEDLEIIIQDGQFIGNLTGIYASGIEGLKLYLNSFDVYRLDVHSNYIYGGVYLDHCTGYEVQENRFLGQTSAAEQVVGLTVNNSGEASNEIYNNTFNHLYIGTLAQNVNRSEKDYDIGLRFKCNTYSNNTYDIAVTGYEGCGGKCGISRSQGSRTNPVGNWFSKINSPVGDFDNQTQEVNYFHHHSVVGQENPWIPLYYSNLNPQTTSIPWSDENSCPSLLGSLRDREINSSMYLSASSISDSIETMLNQLTDGGNTNDLQLDIILAQPDGALELRNTLLDDSPYLSDTVLINSIEKEDVLVPIMVKEIMVANPQSAKSDKIIEALDSRENPLPEYMISEIMQGKDTVAQKEILEAELANYKLQKEIALNRLLSIYQNDTSGLFADSIITLLQNQHTLFATYRSLMKYFEKGDTLSAINTLNIIPVNFDLSLSQELIQQHWIDLMEVLLQIKRDSLMLYDLDSLKIAIVSNLAPYEDLPGCLSRNILHFLGIMETGPYYLLPNDQLKTSSMFSATTHELLANKGPEFEIYPNPGKNYIIVEYNVEDVSSDNLLTIYSPEGKIQFVESLVITSNHLIINTENWPGGIYFFNFITQNNWRTSGKILIIN